MSVFETTQRMRQHTNIQNIQSIHTTACRNMSQTNTSTSKSSKQVGGTSRNRIKHKCNTVPLSRQHTNTKSIYSIHTTAFALSFKQHIKITHAQIMIHRRYKLQENKTYKVYTSLQLYTHLNVSLYKCVGTHVQRYECIECSYMQLYDRI